MPNFGQLPQQQVLLALATQTTNTSSAVFTLPPSSSYRLVLALNTVSGTTPTMDAFLMTSFDNGTTFYNFAKFAQVTTSGIGRQITFRPYVGAGDVAAESAAAVPAVADGATGSATILLNGPINPAQLKLRTVFGGTTPSFAYALHVGSVPQDLSD